jgi:hypothetical protein
VRSPGKPPSGNPRHGGAGSPRDPGQPAGDGDAALTGEIIGDARRRRALPASRHGAPDDDYNFDHLREPASERDDWRRRADPLRADPLGADPLGADPLSADPVEYDPLGSDPLRTDRMRLDEPPPQMPARTGGRGGSWASAPPAPSTERRGVPAGPPPSWQARINASRPATARPGLAVAIMLTAAPALAWLLAVAYGFDHLPLVWTLIAFLAGGGGLALAVRGFPIPGALAVLGGVLGWGLATRDLVPQAATDILGDLRLFGWNLAFATPLLLSYLGALRVDARRSAQAQVQAIADDRRYRSATHDGLAVLEVIPSARFFAVPGKICTHLVAAGRQVTLVGTTVWPRGEYTNDQTDVLRSGRFFGPGTDDVAALMTDIRTWVKRFAETQATCRAFLVVHPASERATDEIRLALPTTEHAELVHADRIGEVIGEFLMREPYRIDVPVIQLVTGKLDDHDPAPQEPASAGRSARVTE